MRLSDAGLRRRQTMALYPNHRLPPWLTEDAPRDRSNRLLDVLRRHERYCPSNEKGKRWYEYKQRCQDKYQHQ